MKSFLLLGIFAGSAAWLLFRNASSATRTVVPAEEAAAKLREAWADYHAS